MASIGTAPSDAQSRQQTAFTVPTAADESLAIDFKSVGCFHERQVRFTYLPLPQPRLIVTEHNQSPTQAITITLAPRQVVELNNLMRFYEKRLSGLCTTTDTVAITLLREDKPVWTESFRDSTCLTETLADADPADLQALHRTEPPVLSLSRVIAQADAARKRGESQTAYLPLPYKRTFAHTRVQLQQDEINERQQAQEVAERTPGYAEMERGFHLTKPELVHESDLLLLQASLQPIPLRLFDEVLWEDPVQGKLGKYDWNDFLAKEQAVEQRLSSHSWLTAWKKSDAGRTISLRSGLLPTPDSSQRMREEVLPAWRHARLKGIPEYEILLRRPAKPFITVYFGTSDSRALIVSAATHSLFSSPPLPAVGGKTASFWLDTLDFSYDTRQAIPQYVVVSPDGTWYRNTRHK